MKPDVPWHSGGPSQGPTQIDVRIAAPPKECLTNAQLPRQEFPPSRLRSVPVPAVAVAVTVTLPEAVAPAMGDVIATAVLVLLTVMLTGDDVAMLPPESVATAARECVALVNLFESSTTTA